MGFFNINSIDKHTGIRNFCTILAFTLCMASFTTGCTPSPATGAYQLILISQSQEIAMGTQAAPELAKQFDGPVTDKVLQEYVSRIGKTVAAKAERDMPWEFTLVNSEVPNAFALPGGKIFVTAGLMLSMTHERQLAAVLGHEIGHVTDRHGIINLERQMGVAVLAELAGYAAGEDYRDLARAGTAIAGSFVSLKYSRNQEYMADELGIRYLSLAGYNPYGMTELLELLKSKSGNNSDSKWLEMLQTHPLTENRIERAQSIIFNNHDSTSTDNLHPNNRMPQMVQRLKSVLEKHKLDKKAKKSKPAESKPAPKHYPALKQ